VEIERIHGMDMLHGLVTGCITGCIRPLTRVHNFRVLI